MANFETSNNEAFYIQKRGLMRKADAIAKSFDSNVFVIMHNRDSDKIFSYTSDPNFGLEHVSELLLNDKKMRNKATQCKIKHQRIKSGRTVDF